MFPVRVISEPEALVKLSVGNSAYPEADMLVVEALVSSVPEAMVRIPVEVLKLIVEVPDKVPLAFVQ